MQNYQTYSSNSSGENNILYQRVVIPASAGMTDYINLSIGLFY